MRKYELVCIFDPQVGDTKIGGLVEKYENYLKEHGAEIANVDRWGLRQLAYGTPSMRKRRQGYYVLYQFQADAAAIRPMEEDLRIDEAVLRYLFTLVQGEFLRVPELVPENQIIFGPPPRDRGDRGRDRDRGRGRRDREGGGYAGRRSEGGGDGAPARRDAGEAADDDAGETEATPATGDGAED
jgi:ribosomal protein S6